MSRATQELPRSRQVFGYRSITFFGSSFQMIHLTIKVPTLGSYNPGPASGPGLGCSLFARRYWGNRILFLFLRLLRCFNSAGVAFQSLCVQQWNSSRKTAGFSHSEIPGSKRVCRYPRLIAASHVLHRLTSPRHSPIALSSFDSIY